MQATRSPAGRVRSQASAAAALKIHHQSPETHRVCRNAVIDVPLWAPHRRGEMKEQKANRECPFEMKEENKLVHSVYFIWFKQGLTFSFPPFPPKHFTQPEKMKKNQPPQGSSSAFVSVCLNPPEAEIMEVSSSERRLAESCWIWNKQPITAVCLIQKHLIYRL